MAKNSQKFFKAIEDRILLCDGAMGTMLQKKGYGAVPDLANLEEHNRSIVREIHFEYLEAGADILLTDTFGSNLYKLKASDHENKLSLINRKAVLSAREAIEKYKEATESSRDIFVAGDIGPSGKLLSPFGDASFEDLTQSFKKQADILLEERVDLILIETMMDLNEALAAIKAVRDNNQDIPLAVTLTFNENGVTLMGNKADIVGRELLSAGADLIGANCSVGSLNMLPIVEKFRSANPEARLIFQPNAGMPKVKDGKTFFDETPEEMAKNMKGFLKYRPSVLGTCCGSTPGHTKKVYQIINEV